MDPLCSFHVMKENYRKAAHVMFECGSRLGLELVTVVGLKKQVFFMGNSFGMSINFQVVFILPSVCG